MTGGLQGSSQSQEWPEKRPFPISCPASRLTQRGMKMTTRTGAERHRMEGRVAIVTGGTRGLGAAEALA